MTFISDSLNGVSSFCSGGDWICRQCGSGNSFIDSECTHCNSEYQSGDDDNEQKESTNE